MNCQEMYTILTHRIDWTEEEIDMRDPGGMGNRMLLKITIEFFYYDDRS